MRSHFHRRPFLVLALTAFFVAITLSLVDKYSKRVSVVLESDDRHHEHDRLDDDSDNVAKHNGIKNAARSRISSAKLVGDIKKVGRICGNLFGLDAVDFIIDCL